MSQFFPLIRRRDGRRRRAGGAGEPGSAGAAVMGALEVGREAKAQRYLHKLTLLPFGDIKLCRNPQREAQ